MDWLNQIIHGDLFDVLPMLPVSSIDVVVTSPPYAEQRKKQYGGISEADYPHWSVRWMAALRPALKDHGSVAIVIRPHLINGQISDYVLRTRLALRAAGWNEAEELIWVKPTSPPLGHIGRPRRSWESILWFSKTASPFCDPVANGVRSDRIGLESTKGMGDYLHDKTMRETGSGVARCRDYIEVPTCNTNKDGFNTHPAQFPIDLADWLIRLLCRKDGIVFDPFSGSGTTLVAAKRAGFAFAGTEISSEYVGIARQRLLDTLGSDDIFIF
jgi:site-specific DNA-methyltransferase (adenine-specific)